MKFIKTSHVVSIRREILNPSEELKTFIFDNINYRRKVWNDFVHVSRENDNWLDFKPLSYLSQYQSETNYKNRRNYCEYVDTSVANDFDKSLKQCRKNLKHHKSPHPQFKSFNKYRGSFTVHNRGYVYKMLDGSNRWNCRVIIPTPREIYFKASRSLHIGFELTEPMFYDHYILNDTIFYVLNKKDFSKGWDMYEVPEYMFCERDIKGISFIHEINHFYIQLLIDMTFINKKSEIKCRQDIAGIDLGIRNPVTIFNGNEFINVEMSNKTIKRIHYLERRAKRLQSIMDIKFKTNKKLGIHPYSKNYEKVRIKFRKTLRHIFMIKDSWKKNICKKIVTSYKKIIVDTFSIPPTTKYSKTNSIVRFYSMSYFMSYIKYCAIKYGTKYIESEPYSTRKCSVCGHINQKMDLNNRVFICNECGYMIDRDMNSARNCYFQEYLIPEK